jgi:hypothetical protein
VTPESRTQWAIAAVLVILLIATLAVGSRCDRQDGDAAPARTSTALPTLILEVRDG